jgi:serine protease Do
MEVPMIFWKKAFFLPIALSFAIASTDLYPQSSWAQKSIAPALKFGDPLPANAFVELAKLINPAVVNISTSTLPKMRPGGGGARDPFFDMLQEFYGFRMQPQTQRPMQALGTGFVIREDGLIVTNNHVIQGADKIQVQLSEKSKLFDAKLIGSDERTDIALIKITTSEKLPVAQLGLSKDMEVGEWVAAFGNPYGQGHTMTKGIISAKGREIGEINKFPLIQTDAPINPGNSGGPLVNMRGQVIGVNSAIDARAQGIGFAIPIDEVKAIIPMLEKEGRIRKGYIGVGLDELNPQAAMYLGLKEAAGALIASVDPSGPAGRAGLKPYDVITEYNSKKIEGVRDLTDSVADTPIGNKAKVKVIREGKAKTLEVTVADRPENPRMRGPGGKPKYSGPTKTAPNNFGFALADINDMLRQQFNIGPEAGNHPVVTEVVPGSKADESGMLPGDVVLEVNRKEVTSAQEVLKQVKKSPLTLRVARGDGILILTF